MKRPVITLFLAFFYASTLVGQGLHFQFHQKQVASDRSYSSRFGKLAADGNLVAVGAPYEGKTPWGSRTFEGAVYIFEEFGGGDLWETIKIVADPRVESEFFGSSVAISGDHLVVGSPRYTTAGNKKRGRVHFFQKGSGGNWFQTGKFAYPDSSIEAALGASVDIVGDWAVVGCPGNSQDIDILGYAYLYKRNSNGVWIEKQRLQSPDLVSYSAFGGAVQMDGNTLAVSAPVSKYITSSGVTIPQAGKVYIFQLDSNGTWTLIQEVVSPTPRGYSGFGGIIELEGNHFAVAVSGEDGVGTGGSTISHSGALYLYERNASNQFVFQQKITSSQQADFQFFGQDIDLENGNLLIGAKTGYHPLDTVSFAGAAFLFQLQNGMWTEVQKLVAPYRNESDHFGGSVAVRGDQLLVGASDQDYDESEMNYIGDAGAFYSFANVPITQTPSPFSQEKGIMVFPNPTSGPFHLDLPEQAGSAIVEVINTMGVTILKKRFKNLSEVQLDLTGVSKGLYLVNVLIDGNAATMSQLKVYLQ